MAIRNLTETLVIDKAANVTFTKDGYMHAAPRMARTGIQLYYGSELGLTGQDAKKIMKVYRPESEVFDTTSLATAAYKPMTNDHPPVPVTSDNWKDYATGQASGDILRDGEYIRIPMALMDKKAIAAYKDGKAELSAGYTCDIAMTPGTAPDGTAYDAVQTNIGFNHFAQVDAARGGAALRIGDGAASSIIDRATIFDAATAITSSKVSLHDAVPEGSQGIAKAKDGKVEFPFYKDGTVYMSGLMAAQATAAAVGDADTLSVVNGLLSFIDRSRDQPTKAVPSQAETKTMKVITVDGIGVQVGDGPDADIINRHIKVLGDTASKLTSDLAAATATHTAVVTTKDGEIAKLTTDLATATAKNVTLEQQLKDNAVTPAKLDSMVADRKIVSDKAKIAMGDKASTLAIDGKTDDEIRSQVVTAKLGDAAKGWTADQVKVSFDTLTAGIDLSKVQPTNDGRGGVFDTARAFSAPSVTSNDAVDKALDARDKRLTDAWKGPQAHA